MSITASNELINSISTVNHLIQGVLAGHYDSDATELHVVGAFWVKQSTQFPGTQQKYRNHYLLLRVAGVFGGCCLEAGQLTPEIADELAGKNIAKLLQDPRVPIKIAALDAYFAYLFPHKKANLAQSLQLPAGTPLERAVVRDEAIVGLLDIRKEQKVGLIGVVNPLVTAITKRGGICLPCDFNMELTQSGIPVTRDMNIVLRDADYIIATGMTLTNGSFDTILAAVRERNIPLVIYAQTGSAIIPQFLGKGVSAIMAEPFPYSQFSAEPTSIYLYRAASNP